MGRRAPVTAFLGEELVIVKVNFVGTLALIIIQTF